MDLLFLSLSDNQNLILIIFAVLAVLAIIVIIIGLLKGLIKTALTIFTLLLSITSGIWIYLKAPVFLSNHFSSIPSYTGAACGIIAAIIALFIITKILSLILAPFNKN